MILIKLKYGDQGLTFSFPCLHEYIRYSTYPMPVKDREQFASLFGGHASYDPEDIVDIAYRGKSLYRAEAYEPQKMEEQESESPTLTL